MYQRRSAPGFGQWVLVTLTIILAGFLGFQLYEYGIQRNLFPAGLQVAGVDVGGMTRAEAEAALTARYIDASIRIYYGEIPIEIEPAEAEFTLAFDKLISRAERERDEQAYWPGYWGYLWNRPIDLEPVVLIDEYFSYNPEALRDTLQTIANQFDVQADPPQPVGSTMSFQYGTPGVVSNIDASIDDVLAALQRPVDREAHLVLENISTSEPDIRLLSTLLVNSVKEFEARSGGVASLYVADLKQSSEVSYQAEMPVSGMNVLRIPLLVEVVRILDAQPLPQQMDLLREAATSDDGAMADALLMVIAGEEDPEKGAVLFNEAMGRIGLGNTFISCPFSAEDTTRCIPRETTANTTEYNGIAPDPHRQTTAEDIGLLLSMLYYCAEADGGALRAIYGAEMPANKCQLVIDLLASNRIGSLIEEGVPDEATVAHRHGWQTDTYGDGAIIYSPGADYVLVEFMHKPGWLAWEVSSPLMADLSRATYNFFNFDSQFLGQ